MTSNEAWNVFKKTGSIYDYITYVKIKSYELNKKLQQQ